jgi:hypothetical protein
VPGGALSNTDGTEVALGVVTSANFTLMTSAIEVPTYPNCHAPSSRVTARLGYCGQKGSTVPGLPDAKHADAAASSRKAATRDIKLVGRKGTES